MIYNSPAAKVPVKGTSAQPVPPDCDGWLLISGSQSCYALSNYLFDNNKEHQAIFRSNNENIAPFYSYVDFFKGETE